MEKSIRLQQADQQMVFEFLTPKDPEYTYVPVYDTGSSECPQAYADLEYQETTTLSPSMFNIVVPRQEHVTYEPVHQNDRSPSEFCICMRLK